MVDDVHLNNENLVKRQIDSLLTFVNLGITIFMISLINGYLYSKLSDIYAKGQLIDISIGYTTAIMGTLLSLVIPGKLHLFKSLSLVSAFFVLLIAESLGRSALSLTCIMVAIFHFAFTLLKRYIDYSHIPHSIIVGLKISLTVMVFFQQFLIFPQGSVSPPRFNFIDYFIYMRNIIGTYEFENMVISAIGTIIMAAFIKVYVRIPWNTLILMAGILFTLLIGPFHQLLTLDKLISINASYIDVSQMVKNNIFNLTNYQLLKDQRLWVYSFGFAIVIWYESMITVNYIRSYTYRHTNSKLESYGLVIGNFICGFFGLLPLSNSFTTNIQIKSLRALDRFYFIGGLLLLLIAPLSVWSLTRFIPVGILPIFYTSMLAAEIKRSDIEFFWKFNKSKLFFVALVPLLCLYIDIIYAFVFSMILYHTLYGFNRSNTYYHFEEATPFFNRALKFIRESKDKVDDDRAVLTIDIEIDRLEDEKTRIASDCIIYSLMGKYSYRYNDFHLNVISHRDENNVIVNFEYIFTQDIDFLGNYYRLLKDIRKLGKKVYITGIDKENFYALVKMFKRSFLLRYHLKNNVYYLA